MRTVLLIVVAVVAFFTWDNLANKGDYTTQLTHTIAQTENFHGLVTLN